MSFIKSVFGYGKKKETKDNKDTKEEEKPNTTKKDIKEESTSSNTKNDSGTNYSKCKAIAFPYIETKESELRVENISLFDGKELIFKKLHQLFVDAVKDYEFTKFEDEYRPPEANKNGGIDFSNKEITTLIRSSGTDIIKQIGRKIIKGDFNLTTISFPIKVMIPLTILQSIARSFFQFPFYMHLAKDKDIYEKMKYTIVASISSFFCSSFFLKPLNPVLGETYEAIFLDGTKVYLEQTSHHPPISHYELYGPNNEWYYCGYSNYASSAGLNSCSVTNKGKRSLRFKDGTFIKYDFAKVRLKKFFY
jgi:hypothetical protein